METRLAVVTGASRGIGRAIVEAMANEGIAVHAVARASADLDALSRLPGVTPWPADVQDPGFHAALAALPHDILINNAGTNTPLPMAEVPADVLDRMLELNVRAAYLVAQASVRAMLAQGRGGAIIHMTSQMGHVGSPRRTAYCMSKHALEGLSKAMAVELAPYAIRSNCVAPTFVETPMTRPMLEDPAFRAFVLDMIPLGRTASPEDIAKAVLYLADAPMVTGTSLLVDGGWTAR